VPAVVQEVNKSVWLRDGKPFIAVIIAFPVREYSRRRRTRLRLLDVGDDVRRL
jgi:hypothetical protein